MDAHTKAMIATFIFMAIWIAVAVGLFWHEARYYRKNPHMWNRRHEGMISLSDNQRYWGYAMWPLVLLGCVGFGLLILVARIFEYYSDRRYDRKYPNIVKLESVQFVGKTEVTLTKVGDHWVPKRWEGYASLRNRFKCAWMVFTGKADALVWPGNQ